MSILRVSPDWDIGTLNTYIAQEENFRRGPLTAIRTDGDTTILEIGDKADKPEINAVVTTERPPPGANIIGNAEVFLRGRRVMVTAYRPAPRQAS